MAEGLEVEPDDLKRAAKDYEEQSGETTTFSSRFEARARLDPDAFANTASSWKLANNYETYYNKVLEDLKVLAKDLDGFGEALTVAAENYEKMEAANTITVKPGDTLWGIAKQNLGDGKRYREIAANNPQIKNPNHIHPGDRIEIRPEEELKLPWPN